jgi:hypothetical protein
LSVEVKAIFYRLPPEGGFPAILTVNIESPACRFVFGEESRFSWNVMKYLIVHTPRKPYGSFPARKGFVEEFAEALRSSVENGGLEGAWSFPGGGCALIFNATTDHEIALEVRNNPLCRNGTNELIPIQDLLGPLKQRTKSGVERRQGALSARFQRSLARWNAKHGNLSPNRTNDPAPRNNKKKQP